MWKVANSKYRRGRWKIRQGRNNKGKGTVLKIADMILGQNVVDTQILFLLIVFGGWVFLDFTCLWIESHL